MKAAGASPRLFLGDAGVADFGGRERFRLWTALFEEARTLVHKVHLT